VAGFDLMRALTACASHLVSFGGHAMAAGLRASPDRIDGFRRALEGYAAEHLAADDLVARTEVDAVASVADLSLAVCDELARLAPFGRGNPAPKVLLRGVRVVTKGRRMGKDERHLSLAVEQDRSTLRVVGWRLGELAERLPLDASLDLVGEPERNTYRGDTSVQLKLTDLRWT
jgi:single-stranded-DNA-specific exonuclease